MQMRSNLHLLSKPGESSMTVTGMYANNVQLPSCADVVSMP